MKSKEPGWTKVDAICGLFLAILTVSLVLLPQLGPRVVRSLDSTVVTQDSGHAFIVPLKLPDPVFYVFLSDKDASAAASTLTLREDGRALGPAHAAHNDIRTSGGGQFSHWGGELYFSARDNSDPRTNGRHYEITANSTLAPWVAILILALNAVFVFAIRKRLLGLARLRRTKIAGAASAVIIAIAFLAARDPYFQAADWPLAISVAGHTLVAVVLTLAHWTVGAGIARLLLPKRETSYAQVALLGFPLGLATLAVLAGVALVVPFGWIVSAGCAIACILPLVRWPLESGPVGDLLRRLPVLVLLSATFGAWLALQWHGPSSTLPGLPSGDLAFYSSMTWAIAARPTTWPNLGNEGETLSHFNMLLPALGAALRPLIDLDGFLFILTTTGVTYLLGASIAMHAYVTARPTFSLWSIEGLALGLAVLATIRYPYWIAESPPVAHVAPLAIAVWFWIAESRRNKTTPLIGLTLAFVGSMMTKVASLITLGTLAVEACLQLAPKLSRRTIVVCALLGAVVAIYAVTMLVWYLPFYFRAARVTPESYELIFTYKASLKVVWPYLAREVGYALMGFVAFRLLPWPAATALAASIAAALAFPFLLRINFMCAAVVLALALIDEPARPRSAKTIFIGALLLCAPAVILTEPGGAAAGFAWLALGTVLVVAALRDREPAAGVLARFDLLEVTTLAVVSLALAALASGTLPLIRHAHSEALPPQARDIWAAVRERVPSGGLVFTDQSGARPTLLAGWNTFALQGQRQIYHANWYQSLKLRNDPELRDARLVENEDVLSGRRVPADVRVSRSYKGYYAVVSVSRSMDSRWERIYGNDLYAIYRWLP